jgi:hypothetical protein
LTYKSDSPILQCKESELLSNYCNENNAVSVEEKEINDESDLGCSRGNVG